jgi:hypothetical protein
MTLHNTLLDYSTLHNVTNHEESQSSQNHGLSLGIPIIKLPKTAKFETQTGGIIL